MIWRCGDGGVPVVCEGEVAEVDGAVRVGVVGRLVVVGLGRAGVEAGGALFGGEEGLGGVSAEAGGEAFAPQLDLSTEGQVAALVSVAGAHGGVYVAGGLLDRGHEAGDSAEDAEEPVSPVEVEGGDDEALAHVVLEHGLGFAAGALAADDGGDFEVQAEAAVIEVGGADGDKVVAEADLLVHEAGLVAEDFDAGFDGVVVEGEGGEPDEAHVEAFGDDDADVDAAESGELECVDGGFVGDEVGGGDPEAALCLVEEVVEHEAAGFEIVRGA